MPVGRFRSLFPLMALVIAMFLPSMAAAHLSSDFCSCVDVHIEYDDIDIRAVVLPAVIRRDDADSFVHTGRSSDAADDVATARTRLDAHRYAQVSSPVWVPYRRA